MELDRYQRQMMIPGWGESGQAKLREATIFMAGAGGLGCPAAIFLTVAGIGRLRLCDPGQVCLTNLNRQVLYREWDIGKSKVYCAREALAELNPAVMVTPLNERITAENVEALIGDCVVILDCLDNFATRHILNACAVNKGIPLVHAGIEGLAGQVTFIHPPETPCLYCMYPGAPSPKDFFPVAGVNPGVIGTLQASEAIKYILGIGENIKGSLLVWDGATMEFKRIPVSKDPACPVCGRAGL